MDLEVVYREINEHHASWLMGGRVRDDRRRRGEQHILSHRIVGITRVLCALSDEVADLLCSHVTDLYLCARTTKQRAATGKPYPDVKKLT